MLYSMWFCFSWFEASNEKKSCNRVSKSIVLHKDIAKDETTTDMFSSLALFLTNFWFSFLDWILNLVGGCLIVLQRRLLSNSQNQHFCILESSWNSRAVYFGPLRPSDYRTIDFGHLKVLCITEQSTKRKNWRIKSEKGLAGRFQKHNICICFMSCLVCVQNKGAGGAAAWSFFDWRLKSKQKYIEYSMVRRLLYAWANCSKNRSSNNRVKSHIFFTAPIVCQIAIA